MAVKIWDAQANAFKDAEIPMVWDSQAGAYKDSTGLVYDESAGAWSERWGDNKVWLYKDGDECTGITGGWSFIQNPNYPSKSKLTKNTTNMRLWVDGANYYGGVVTENPISIGDKMILCFSGDFDMRSSYEGATRIAAIAFPTKHSIFTTDDSIYFQNIIYCDNPDVTRGYVVAAQNQKAKIIKCSLTKGKYYLCFGVPTGVVNATIDKIWLE